MVLSQEVGGSPSADGGEPSPATPEPEAPQERGRWSRAWRIGALYWLICHVGYLAVQFIALRFVPVTPGGGRGWLSQVINNWVQWDGRNYVHIANFGYPVVDDPGFKTVDSSYPVWPPLYPALVRLASYVLPSDMSFAALVVSNLAALGMLVVLYRLAEHELGPRLSERTLLMLIAFPTAFFLATAYTESLFLFLTFAALYCARRNHWWAAGLLAGAASATRVLGVLIVFAFAYEYLRQRDFSWRRIRIDVLGVALAPLGLVLYMAYLWQRFGNPMQFRDAQSFWGRGGMHAPWTTISHSLRGISLSQNPNGAVLNLLDLAACIMGLTFLVLCFVGPWRLRRDQFYLVLAGALPFLVAILQPVNINSGTPMQSLNRYVLGLFPMFFVMAKMANNRFVEKLILFAALPLQTGLIMLYISGQWAG
ncbi:mannosyltransferase family protein [Dactylosporangium sp. CS-033363]|uniref:mannosyltransferase family protein n=1 Tax=Dactylosporangium sp. CS-033363 TaxID=3239935 RepID=UPI003D90CCD7